jgi:hypothetical protein
MKKYETRHVVIEAAEWTGTTLADAISFCAENNFPPFKVGSLKGMTGLIIPTLEGDHVAQKGDYIIKGLQGEYYPCKPDIFHLKYTQYHSSGGRPDRRFNEGFENK